MQTMQEAYSGVVCEIMCHIFQIVGKGVAWLCRAWSSLDVTKYSVWMGWPNVRSMTKTATTCINTCIQMSQYALHACITALH